MCHLSWLVASHLTGLHTSWITSSHPADFFYFVYFFFYAPSSRPFFARRRGVHRSCRPQLDTCEVFLLAKLCVGVFSPSLAAPFSSSLCRPPAFWAALSPCLLPALAHSDSQLLLSENQEAACPTYTQSRIGSGRAGEETAGVGRAQGEGEKGQERGPALAR